MPLARIETRYSRAPVVTDDVTKGYGDAWFWEDQTSALIYKCIDNTTGAAVWRGIEQSEASAAALALKASKAVNETISGYWTFSNGFKTGKVVPLADSTSAIQVMKANGTTPIVTFDTVNDRMGVGTPTPSERLEVAGKIKVTDTTQSTSIASGSITTAGGAGIAKALFVGEGITFGNGTDATLKFNSTNSVASGGGNLQYINLTPSAGNATMGLRIRPAGTSTLMPAITLNNTFDAATSSNNFFFGVGDSSLPSYSINWIASTIQGVAFANSRPIGFLVSSTSGGRFCAMMLDYTGNVGIGTGINAPTAPLSISEKSAMNEVGGFMIKLTNKTGANSVRGTVVYASPTTDNAFGINPTNGDMPFGVVFTNGIADGAECWVVVSGVAEVLLVNSVATTRGYIALSSTTVAGRIDTAATVPAATQHFTEIGHTIESKAGGTNVLVKCVLHFN